MIVNLIGGVMSWNFNYTAKGTKGRDAQVSVEEAMGGKPPCTLVTFAGVAEPSDAPCLEHGDCLRQSCE